MKTFFRSLSLVVGLAALLFACVSMLFGIFHFGILYLLLYGGVLVATLLLWDAFDGWGRLHRRLHEVSDHRPPHIPKPWIITRRILSILLTMATLFGAGMSGYMLPLVLTPPREPMPQTAIVLGCRAYNGKPSTMLAMRLDRAYTYLVENPEAVAIVSGGMDTGETISEAQTMFDDLVARGIAPERILMEDQSTSTYQNMQFSADLLRAMGRDTRVTVISNGFHLPRGILYAEQMGLHAEGAAAKTPWGLIPGYWIREWAAISRAIIMPG